MRRSEVRSYKLSRPDKRRPDFLGEVIIAAVTSTVRDTDQFLYQPNRKEMT
jgi:hypothetical protein